MRAIFEEILERPPGERRQRVLERCAGDRELARDVFDLLDAHGHPSALDRPVVSLGEETGGTGSGEHGSGEHGRRGPDPGLDRGQRLGAFEIEERLGSGGMGTVYRARRADGVVDQRVAIKVLRGDVADHEMAARLRRERQILADLRHPHIARLLDGGALEDGRPYLVMECVEGVPLDRALVDRAPSLEERLGWMLDLAEAVAHAHRHGVVHRDLKPANVLIDGDGRPVLLDFGIAGLTEVGKRHLTTPGRSPMTLRYASPEQIAGRGAGPTSDVYSLGVLLYELLTGHSPYGDGLDLFTQCQAVLADAVPPASRRAAGSSRPEASWRRRLRGDLDAVVAKALAKDPSRRYATAEELAKDLRRFLEGRPVDAGRDHLSRWRRHLRRQRRPLATAASLLLAAGAVWQISAIQRSGTEARRVAAELAAEVGTEGDRLLELGDAEAASRHHRRSLDALDALGLEDDPQKTRSLSALGLALSRRGDFEHGERLLLQAIDAAASLGRPQPGVRSLALRRYGHHLVERGLPGEASKVYERALQSDQDLSRAARAGLLLDLSGAVAYRSRMAYADQLIDRAGDLVATLPDDHPARMAYLEKRGFSAFVKTRFRDAEAIARKALDKARSARRPFEEYSALRLLCMALRDQLRPEPSETACREASEAAARLFGTDHPAYAESLVRRSEISIAADRPFAMDLAGEALEIYRKSAGGSHPMIANITHYQALDSLRRDEFETAETLHQRSLVLFRDSVGADHPNVAYSHLRMGFTRESRGQRGAAIEGIRTAAEIIERSFSSDHPRRAWPWALLAVHLADVDPVEAEAVASKALELAGGVHGADGGIDAAAVLVYLGAGDTEALARQLEAARAYATRAVCMRLARLYDYWQQPEEAAAWRAAGGSPT